MGKTQGHEGQCRSGLKVGGIGKSLKRSQKP